VIARVKTRRLGWTAEAASRNVTVIRMDVAKGFEQRFLLRSDVHHDNPKSRRDMERRHLEEAKERGAGVLDFGDLFCAMPGKYDKRSCKSDVRPEHQKGEYLDALVNCAADFYRPYAENLIVLGDGNHETSIKQRHETDLIERLCGKLSTAGNHVQHGGYSGWVRFMFSRNKVRQSVRLWYMHGYGGGGPVTQDVIQAQRQRSYIEGADIIVSGHTHDCWAMESVKLQLNGANVVEHRPVWNVKCPTYKEEYVSGESGWHVGTGKPPKPLGAWWLVFRWDGTGSRPLISFERAS
jgi:predicted phosphodiesterase